MTRWFFITYSGVTNVTPQTKQRRTDGHGNTIARDVCGRALRSKAGFVREKHTTGTPCRRAVRGLANPAAYARRSHGVYTRSLPGFIIVSRCPEHDKKQTQLPPASLAGGLGRGSRSESTERQAGPKAQSPGTNTRGVHTGRHEEDSRCSGAAGRDYRGSRVGRLLEFSDTDVLRDWRSDRCDSKDVPSGLRSNYRDAHSSRCERQNRKDAFSPAVSQDHTRDRQNGTGSTITRLALEQEPMLAVQAVGTPDSQARWRRLRAVEGRHLPQVSTHGRHIVRGQRRRRLASPRKHTCRFRAALSRRKSCRERTVPVSTAALGVFRS